MYTLLGLLLVVVMKDPHVVTIVDVVVVVDLPVYVVDMN